VENPSGVWGADSGQIKPRQSPHLVKTSSHHPIMKPCTTRTALVSIHSSLRRAGEFCHNTRTRIWVHCGSLLDNAIRLLCEETLPYGARSFAVLKRVYVGHYPFARLGRIWLGCRFAPWRRCGVSPLGCGVPGNADTARDASTIIAPDSTNLHHKTEQNRPCLCVA
jgi:hypothetical protein